MSPCKVSEAEGEILDWMVAHAKFGRSHAFSASDIKVWASVNTPSKNWASGGPIIEQEGIELKRSLVRPFVWAAFAYNNPLAHRCGPTSLIAAMRCYVASKLGDEVEVPEELL